MRQSISNFWHRRLGGLCPGVSRPVTVKFHFILCCFRCPFPAFNDCFMFSTFFTISASFRFVPQVPHFSRFFFRPSLLLVAACACFCAVTEDGHCLKSRGGGLSLGLPDPRFSHSRPSLRFHRFRTGSFPRLSARLRFRRRSTRSRSSHTVPTSH